MNIQEYISSGIVESYVLGLASDEERLEFEQRCATNAELMQAREAFELSLEQHALSNALPVPAGLKQKIWNDINLGTASAPIIAMQPVSDNQLQSLSPVRSGGFAKFLAAASVILLVGSTLLNFYFYNRYKSSVAKLNELIASTQQMATNNGIMQTRLQQYERNFEMIKDSNMAVIAMKGQPVVAPKGLTTVYWNKETKDVYLLINSLPQPAAGKQYQLWAIVDGQPVSAGLLDTDPTVAFIKMKNIPKAQAFAITLENTGGSKTPTMPIYVVGKT